MDDIRIRFQGGVELVLAPPAAIPALVFPELMAPSTARASPAELMSLLRDVAAAGVQMKSSLSPHRPVPSLPAPSPPTPSVKKEAKIEYVARDDVAEGRGSPPSKRFCKCVYNLGDG